MYKRMRSIPLSFYKYRSASSRNASSSVFLLGFAVKMIVRIEGSLLRADVNKAIPSNTSKFKSEIRRSNYSRARNSIPAIEDVADSTSLALSSNSFFKNSIYSKLSSTINILSIIYLFFSWVTNP